MDELEILFPILAHILLVVLLFFLLLVRKKSAVKAGEVDLTKTALDNSAWPSEVLKVSNNIVNQFETPILFYVLCIIISVADIVGPLNVGLAWAYVALRYLHSFIHTGSNVVPVRMKVFSLSLFIIIALLGLTAFQLASIA